MSATTKPLETLHDQNSIKQQSSPSDQNQFRGFDMANLESHSIDQNFPSNIHGGTNEDNFDLVSQIDDFEMPDEKNEVETVKRLRQRNLELRAELKSLNDQLTVLVSKKKYAKPEFPKLAGSASPNFHDNEKILEMGLENAKKQLAIYQKEWKHLKQKYQEMDDPNKLIDLENKVLELDDKISKESQANKALTKEIREKNKLIDSLQSNSPTNPKESVLGDGIEGMRKKLKLIKAKEQRLQSQSDSKDEYIKKLQAELVKAKEEYRKATQITGYSEEREKERAAKKLKTFSVSRIRQPLDKSKILVKNSAAASWRVQSDGQEDLIFNEDNFQKLQADLRVLEKANVVKDKTRNRELARLKSDLIVVDSEKEESQAMLIEKEKEVDALNAAFQELYDIFVQHNLKITSPEKPKKKNDANMRRSASPSPKESTDGLSVNSRKPQKLREGEFNDKDLIGETRVKICGVRVWHDGKKLNGIQGIYRQADGKILKGKKHIENPYKYKAVKFDMEEDDYLKDVTGYVSQEGDAVQCLIFRSAKNILRKVGTFGEESKQFKFDINDNEFPAIIYGAIKNGSEGSVLLRVGILIASDDNEEVLDNGTAGDDFFAHTSIPSEHFTKANKKNMKQALANEKA